MTLTFDLLIWKWYMTLCSLMGCVSATYEANPSNCHQSMKRTEPKIWMTHASSPLTYWHENGMWYIVLSWVVFVPHMNIIHEIGNQLKFQPGKGWFVWPKWCHATQYHAILQQLFQRMAWCHRAMLTYHQMATEIWVNIDYGNGLRITWTKVDISSMRFCGTHQGLFYRKCSTYQSV